MSEISLQSLLMYVRCDGPSLYSRINYVRALTGNFSGDVRE